MKLFENKLNRIDEILKGKETFYKSIESSYYPQFVKALSESTTCIEKSKEDKVVAKVNYDDIRSLYGTHKFSFAEPRIGPHPDFKHILHNQYLSHYAVSMFIDIKGSTELVNKYSLLQIRQIKDTILTLAIEVCSFFGGHIQRLQGDGVFVYFVRAKMNPKDATINAINAASLLAFFMQYNLPTFFQNEEIKAPQIRIGIDYGNEQKTIWSYYGLPYCNELTTTGLHTDLAAKLQAASKGNGIMIGYNIVDELDLPEKFAKIDSNDKEIFPGYNKYRFEWSDYLLSYDFFKKDSNGNLLIESPKLRLNCEIAENEHSQYLRYHQNLYSIPKGYRIRFTLMDGDNEYRIKTEFKEEVRWEINNTGAQAKSANILKEEVKDCNNKTSCIVDAEFLGHHYMLCKIIKQSITPNINVLFSLYVS